MADPSFLTFVLEQLDSLGGVTPRAMFASQGLYAGDVHFAIVSAGRLYLKVDDQTRGDFEAADMGPFRPNDKQTLASYYEVPLEVLEDRGELAQWARRAIEAQKRATGKKNRRRSRGTT